MRMLENELDKMAVKVKPGVAVRLAGLADPRTRASKRPRSKKALLAWYKRFGYDKIPDDSDIAYRNVVSVLEGDGKQRKDRFSRGFRALYGAETAAVALSEMRYYSRTHFYRPGAKNEFQFTEFKIKTLGKLANLIPLYTKGFGIKDDEKVCWHIGQYMRRKTDTLIFKSVRTTGLNHVIYRKNPILSAKLGEKFVVKVVTDRNGKRKTIIRP